MRIVSIKTVVHDGRQNSVATPYVIAPWEVGPFRTCDAEVDRKRCGDPTVQLVTREGERARTWAEGRCIEHSLPALSCPVLRGAWWRGNIVVDRSRPGLLRVLEVWPTAPVLLAADLATGIEHILAKGLDHDSVAYPRRTYESPEHWYTRHGMQDALAAYRERLALAAAGQA